MLSYMIEVLTPFERNSFSTLGFYLLSMDYSDTILCWETSYGVAYVSGEEGVHPKMCCPVDSSSDHETI